MAISTGGMTGVALVTGAASGIGAACAQSFIDKGVTRLVLADFNEESLQKVVSALQAKHSDVQILPVVTDIAEEASVKAMIAAAVDKFQRIDYAANCAGVGGAKPIAQTTLEDFDRVMNVNCRGTFVCIREELNVMMKQDPLPSAKPGREQRGAIVTIASVLGLRSIPYTVSYNAAKHAVVGFSKTAAQEAGAHKIRVNSVAPGVIKTAMTTSDPRTAAVLAPISTRTPIGRDGEPAEVADVIAFMCSEDASYVTGACWEIDGGFTS